MAGPAALISFVSGAPQNTQLGKAFLKPLVALVTDANGNPVSGVAVTFVQQGGQSAFCTFAGGVNTAVTNGSGLATSAAITAGGTAGQYPVQAWIGTPGPGAVGPATFTLSNSTPGPYTPGSVPLITAAWTSAKAHLATLRADLATVLADLANLEADRDALYAAGAGDVADYLAVQIQQAGGVGFQPRISGNGGTTPQVVRVMATNPAVARDLSVIDGRPVTTTPTGQYAQLS